MLLLGLCCCWLSDNRFQDVPAVDWDFSVPSVKIPELGEAMLSSVLDCGDTVCDVGLIKPLLGVLGDDE